jgi:hypothetical protein
MRTAARIEVVGADGLTYTVRAIRVMWPRDVSGADLAGGILPGNFGSVADGATLFAVHARWGVRVTRKTPRLRSSYLVYGEEAATAGDAVTRALDIAQRLTVVTVPPRRERRG